MNFKAWIFAVNREDLLHKAIRSMEYARDVLTVIDNSPNGIGSVPFGTIFRPPVPLTFAQSQNYILQESYKSGCPFYLWIHADAEALGDSCQKMVGLAESLERSHKKWSVCFSSYDAFAAFNTKAFLNVGGWDTEFPWYFSDGSVYHKLRVAGYEFIESGLPVKHEPSQTIKSDSGLYFLNSMTFPLYEYLYSQMWGGQPGKEKFKTKFNR